MRGLLLLLFLGWGACVLPQVSISTEIATLDAGDVFHYCDTRHNTSLVLVYVHFSPADELVVVGKANITTDAVGGFYVSPYWTSLTPPQRSLLSLEPSIGCSSYVSFGMRIKESGASSPRDCVGFTPDFNLTAGSLRGGWYCTPPYTDTTNTGTKLLVMQLAVRRGARVTGSFTVIWDQMARESLFSFDTDTDSGTASHTVVDHQMHTTLAPTLAPGTGYIGPIVIATIGVIILLVLLTIVACCCWRKRSHSKAQASAIGSAEVELSHVDIR